MQCSDLDRYLEAYLDERLGRGRSAILRRHVNSCSTCQARLTGLRKFETELNRKFRAMAAVESIWSGLELDLVRSSSDDTPRTPVVHSIPQQLARGPVIKPVDQPPAAKSPQTTVQEVRGKQTSQVKRDKWLKRSSLFLVGAAMLAAASGTVYNLMEPAFRSTATAFVAEDLAAFKEPQIDHATNNTVELRRWFLRQTGTIYPTLPAPETFALTGGSIAWNETVPTAVAIYKNQDQSAYLAITPIAGTGNADNAFGGLHSVQDMTVTSFDQPALSGEPVAKTVRWQDERFSYLLTSDMAATPVDAFKAQ